MGTWPRPLQSLSASECGQQDPRSGGDESPPALAGRQLIVYVKACSGEGFCHPTLPLSLSLPSSSPWVAPFATLRTQTGSSAQDARGECLPLMPPGSSPSHTAERLSVGGGNQAVTGPTDQGRCCGVCGWCLFCDPRTDKLPVRSLK